MSAVLPRARGHRPRRHARPRPGRDGRALRPDWNPLAVALHDFRTPLTVIATAAELLQSRLEHGGASEEVVLVHRIRRNTSWLASLLDNLAVEMELSTSDLALDWSVVDLQECLESSLAIVQTVVEQRQQRVQLCAEGVAPVRGDRRQIGQVLINLLLNASKYGDAHSVIRLAVTTARGWTRIEIHNDGPSIPLAEQEQIFARFVRGSNAQGTGAPGLGLGLHIVKTIVERHGGQVGVVSTPAEGTRVWVTLPAVG